MGETNVIFNYTRDQKFINVGITATGVGGAITSGDVTNDDTINLTFTVGNFETSHNFDQSHINVTNGTLTNFVDNKDNTFSAVLESETDGQCIITVNANTFQDKIFNNNSLGQIWTRDTKPPVIKLAAPNIIQHRINTIFTAPVANATDNVNGVAQNPAPAVNVDVSLLDTTVVGDYSISYDSTDNAGNKSILTRIVRVIDDVDPVITLVGDSPIILELGNNYNDLGVIITDDSVTIDTTTSNVNTNKVGNYEVVYTSRDIYGNTTTLTRQVNVIDNTLPTLILKGPNPYSIIQGGSYIEFGSTANDLSGQVNTTIEHNVNTSVLGDYVVTYTAEDINGNQTVKTRDVRIFDNIRPTIQITSNTINQNEVINKNVIHFKFTVSENSNFGQASITVVNGDLQNFVDNTDNTYDVEFVPKADGICSIKVEENAFQDNSNTPNGNVASNTFSFTRDTTAPMIPVYNYHQIQNRGFVTIHGYNDAKTTVYLLIDGNVITSQFFQTEIFSFTIALSDGSYNITFYGVDILGNTSDVSNVTNIVIDTTPPNIPTITNTTLTKIAENSSTVVFTGSCDPDVLIKLYDNNKNLLVSVNSNALTGIFSFTLNNVTDGNNIFYFTSIDNVGNESIFRRKDVFIDTTAPNVPSVSSVSIVEKNKVKIVGVAEPNSTVKVYSGIFTIKGSGKANSLGFFEITTSAFTHGNYNLQLTATDNRTNESGRTGKFNVNIDLEVQDLVEIFPATPRNNTTLTYTFQAFEFGTIHSNYNFTTTRNAINGINTITFVVSNSGTYNNIYVQLEDNNGNFSKKLYFI